MLIGAAAADITPPVGVELFGYGPYLNRRSTGVRDRLMAKAIYAADGKNQLLFIGNDLVGVAPSLTAEVRRLMGRHLGLDAASIMLAGTHTHSGPGTHDSFGQGARDALYFDHLPYIYLELAREAMAKAAPAELCMAKGPVASMGIDRHDPAGPVDKELRVIHFSSEGKVIAILANHAIHGVVFGQSNTMISGDWPGVFQRALESAYPGAVAAFAQGSSGTVNSNPACLSFEEGDPHVERIGNYLAEEAVKLIKAAKPVKGVSSLACVSEKVDLPLRVIEKEVLEASRDENLRKMEAAANDYDYHSNRLRYGVYQRLVDSYVDGPRDKVTVELQVFKIGPVRIVGVPGEMFMALGQKILDAWDAGPVILVTSANESIGYFPTREAFSDDRYAYPTDIVAIIKGRFPFASEAGEMLAARAVQLMKQL